MRLVSIQHDETNRGLGCIIGPDVVDLTAAALEDPNIPSSAAAALENMESLLEAGVAGLATCRQLADSVAVGSPFRHNADSVKIGPPLRQPSQIIAVGRNYVDHAAEAAAALPDLPRLFPKWPSTVIGINEPIIRPKRTRQLDWEVEFAVIIGKPASYVSKEAALDYVFGYTILNDVSARDIQFSKPEQLTLGKNFRTFTPMGECIVTADEIPDPSIITIRSWVNDELMQESNTKHLIFDVPTLISFISEVMDLAPGDVISTGTPSGTGCFREPPIWLKGGDRVRMELELNEATLCELSNPVLDAE